MDLLDGSIYLPRLKSMRNDYKYLKLNQEFKRLLEPTVLHELAGEIRRELEAHHPPLPLTSAELDRLAGHMAWVASEAYWRGYNRLVPTDF